MLLCIFFMIIIWDCYETFKSIERKQQQIVTKKYDYYDYYLLHHKQNKKETPLIIGMKYAIA